MKKDVNETEVRDFTDRVQNSGHNDAHRGLENSACKVKMSTTTKKNRKRYPVEITKLKNTVIELKNT